MKILLASPRGFCAGVDRAISIVEKALQMHGSPVYVRHEIVHNESVVSALREKGAVFVEELDEVPDEAVVIFSAHGVPAAVYKESERRALTAIDATCPLVKKVHSSVQRHHGRDTRIILIGHEGHPEVIGTMGQLEEGEVILVSSPEDVEQLDSLDTENLAFTTQTTLSIDETRGVIEALKKKFPDIKGPAKGDLCYATTNRQQAVLQIANQVDLLLVVGSNNSSNSNRLREIGAANGVPSYLVGGPHVLEESWFDNVETVGISSGASAPEDLVQAVVAWIRDRFPETGVESLVLMEENVHFPLPRELTAPRSS